MTKLADVETQTKVRCGRIGDKERGDPVEILYERTESADLVYITVGERDGQHVTLSLADFFDLGEKVQRGLLLLSVPPAQVVNITNYQAPGDYGMAMTPKTSDRDDGAQPTNKEPRRGLFGRRV